MNYYERHLGDYARDTAHLSLLEHGVYTILLDRYYVTEQGIPDSQKYRLARAHSEEERAAVDAVLCEFFVLIEKTQEKPNGFSLGYENEKVWINNRADEEIGKARSKINASRENGKKGGRPPKQQEKTHEKPNGFLVGFEKETQQKAHQTPDTKHHNCTVLSAREDEIGVNVDMARSDVFTSAMRWVEFFVNEKGFQIHAAQTATTIPMFVDWVKRGICVEDVEMAIAAAHGWLTKKGKSHADNPAFYAQFLETILVEKQKSPSALQSGSGSNSNNKNVSGNYDRNKLEKKSETDRVFNEKYAHLFQT